MTKKYRAWSVSQYTDGTFTWSEGSLNLTVEPTAADMEAFAKEFMAGDPAAVIAWLQTQLDNVADHPDEGVQFHADLIRKDLAALEHLRDGRQATLDELKRIDGAWLRWHEKVLVRRDLVPQAAIGRKFKNNQRSRKPHPIRAAIRRLLQKNRSMTGTDVWAALKTNPPAGHLVCDNRAGRYLEHEKSGETTGYERIMNVVSEERKALKRT